MPAYGFRARRDQLPAVLRLVAADIESFRGLLGGDESDDARIEAAMALGPKVAWAAGELVALTENLVNNLRSAGITVEGVVDELLPPEDA